MQNIQIAKNIKQLCKDKGITLTELLQHCELSKSFIYDLEKRAASPSCQKITNIADYLNCSVDYLLGRTDNPNLNFLDGRSIMNNPNLMKMYKLLQVYPSADYLLPRTRFLSPEGIKEVAVRRNESTERADFIVHFQSNRMEPIYNEGD